MANIDFLIVGGGGAGGIGGSLGNGFGGGGGAGGFFESNQKQAVATKNGTGTYTLRAGGTLEVSQTFTLDSTAYTITGADAYVDITTDGGATGVTSTISIFEADSTGKPTGTALATASSSLSLSTTGVQPYHIDLASPFTFDSTKSYTLVLSGNDKAWGGNFESGNTASTGTFQSTDRGATFSAVNGPVHIVIYGQKKYSLTYGSYDVVVGAGGVIGVVPNLNIPAGNGGISSFNGISMAGGGGGGYSQANIGQGTVDANNGASGGGAGFNGSQYFGTAGTGIAGEGYAGAVYGPSGASVAETAGGGGGASAIPPVDSNGGTAEGGPGIASSITGTLKYYAGGGGGAVTNQTNYTNTGGSGVGATGAFSADGYSPQGAATAAVQNTGSGGGGAAWAYASSDGADGVVIVRYENGAFGSDSSGGTKSYTTIGGQLYVVHTFNASGTLQLTNGSGDFLLMM